MTTTSENVNLSTLYILAKKSTFSSGNHLHHQCTMAQQTKYHCYLNAADVKNDDDDDDDSSDQSIRHDLAKFLISILCKKKGKDSLKTLMAEKGSAFKHFGIHELSELKDFCSAYPQCFTVHAPTPTEHSHVEDSEVEVVAAVQICPTHVKMVGSCPEDGECGCLHVCKFYMLSGKCEYSTQRKIVCHFGHNMHTDHNDVILKRHLIDHLDVAELRNLVQQRKARTRQTRPMYCRFYNKSGGCGRGEKCTALHVCRGFVSGVCKFGEKCRRNHDLNEPGVKAILEQYAVKPEELRDLMADNQQETSVQAPIPTPPAASLPVHPPLSTQSAHSGLYPQLGAHHSFPGQSGSVVQTGQTFWGSCAAGSPTGEGYWGVCLSDASQGGYWGPCPEDAAFTVSAEETESNLPQNAESVTKSTHFTLPLTLFSQRRGHVAACQEEAGPPEAREEVEMGDGNKTDEVNFLSLNPFRYMNVHDADREEKPENWHLSKTQEITQVSGVGTMPSHTAAIARPSSDLSATAVGSHSLEDIVSEKTQDSSFIPLKTTEKNAAENITWRPVASVPPQVKIKPKLGSCAPGGIPKPSQEVLFGCSKTTDPEKPFSVDGQSKKNSDNVDDENSSAAELAAGSSNPEGITGENVSSADVATNQPANDLKSIIADLISNVKKLHSVNTGPEVPIMSFLSNLADPAKPRDVLPAAKETVGTQQDECQMSTQYLSEGEIPESDQEVEASTSDKTAESEPQKLLFEYNHQPACQMIGNMVKETRNSTEAQLSHDSPSCSQQQLQKDPVTSQEHGAVLESHRKRHGKHLQQRKSRERFSTDGKAQVQYEAAGISEDNLELADSAEDCISDILSMEETLEPIESSTAESKQTEKERDGSYIHSAKDDTEHKGLAEHHIIGKESDGCVQDRQTIQPGDDDIQESNSSRNVKTDRPVSESERGNEQTLHEISSAKSSVPTVSSLDHKVNQSQISPSRKLSSTRSTSPKGSRSSSNQRESSADQRKYYSVTKNSAGGNTILEPRHSAPRLSDSGMSSRYERPLREGKPQNSERKRVHLSGPDRSSTDVYDSHSMERSGFISKRNRSNFDHHSDRSNMARENPKHSRYSSTHHSDGPQRLSSREGRHNPDHRRRSPDRKGMSLGSGARRSTSNDRRSWNNERKTHHSSARSSSPQQSTSTDWRTGPHHGRYSPMRRNEFCDRDKSLVFSRQLSPNRRGKPEPGHSPASYRESRREHSPDRDRHRLERGSAEYLENTRDWRDERRERLRDVSCDTRFRERSPEHSREMYSHITRGHSPCQDRHRSRFSTEHDQVRSTNRDRERSWDGQREKDSVVSRDCDVIMGEGMRPWGRDRWTEGHSEGRHSGCRERSVENNVMDRLGPSPVRFKHRQEQGHSFLEEEGLGFEEVQHLPLTGGLDQNWPNDEDMEGTREQRRDRHGYRGKYPFVGKLSNRFASYEKEKRVAGNTAENGENNLDNSFSEPEVTLKYSSQSDEDDGNERLLAPDYRRIRSRQDWADDDQLMVEDYGSEQLGSMFSFGKRGRDSQDDHRKLETEDQHRTEKRRRGYESSSFRRKGLHLDSHDLAERSPRRQENEQFQELSMLHAEDGGREGHREYRHRLGETGDCSPSAHGSGGLSEHIDLLLCDARHSSSRGRHFFAPDFDSNPFHSQHEAARDADLGHDFHQKSGDTHFKQNLRRGFPRKRRAVHQGCNKLGSTKRQQISPDKDQRETQYDQTLHGRRGNARARRGNERSRLWNARGRNRKMHVGCLASSRGLSSDRQDRPGRPPHKSQSRDPLERRHSQPFPESYGDVRSDSPSAEKFDPRPSNRTDGLSKADQGKWRSESRVNVLFNDDAPFEDGSATLGSDCLDEKQLPPHEDSDRDFEMFCNENNFTEIENNDEEFHPELFSYDDDDADVMQVPRPQVRSRDLRHVLRKRRRSGPLLQAEMEPIQIRLHRQSRRESDL